MELSVINIGNSKGIRLSKTILKKYHITDKVELLFEDNRLVLKPKLTPRQNWGEAFRMMHEAGDDALLITDIFEDEIFEEWNQ
jgi:antitoxin MazE